MTSENQKERELDKLLLLLSQPLTRLILSVLAGLDPRPGSKKPSAETDHSDDGFVKDGFD